MFGLAQVGALIAALARVSGLVATAPVVGDGGVSVRAKLVLVVAVAAAVGLARPPVELAELPATALLELAVGAVTGASARFVVARVAVAGQLAGFALGLGFASQYDTHAGESAGTLRTLMSTLAGLAFVAAGGLAALVRGAAAAPAHVGDLAALVPLAIGDAAAAFGRGVAIAAPNLVAGIVGHLGLAVMNRAAPAVNVFSVALVAVLVLGGAVLVWSAPATTAAAFAAARDAIERLLG